MLTAQSTLAEIAHALRENIVSRRDYLTILEPAIDKAKALNCFIVAPNETANQPFDGPLYGVPVSIKDNVALDGLPTTGATASFENLKIAESDTVKSLRLAGAVFAGKTNLHELAFGITGANAFSGDVLNPFNPKFLAGGSSSGAAVSVATGAAALAVGTDTGGSCRIPAAHCGVVGFRPTTGRYSSDGYIELSASRDTLGLIARCVNDIKIADNIITGEGLSCEPPKPSDITLGVVAPESFGVGYQPEILTLYEQTLKTLEEQGILFREIDFTDVIVSDEACGFAIAVFETYQSLEKRLQAIPGLSMVDFIDSIKSQDVKGMIAMQTGPDAIPSNVYENAIKEQLPKLRRAFESLFSDNCITALIYPTSLFLPPPRDIGDTIATAPNEQEVPTFPAYTATTRPDSMAGQPSITLPYGLVSALPVGLQLVGPRYSDSKLLEIAQVIERLLPSRPIPQ